MITRLNRPDLVVEKKNKKKKQTNQNTIDDQELVVIRRDYPGLFVETNDNSKSQGSKEIGLIRFNSGPRVRARVRARVRGEGKLGERREWWLPRSVGPLVTHGT